MNEVRNLDSILSDPESNKSIDKKNCEEDVADED